jgi:cysteine desulfuration protein SufE
MKTLEELVDIFELLDDWDQRYSFIIELGEQLPAMPLCLKTDGNKVRGCMSQVWVSPYRTKGTPDRVSYHADCDTAIIKGVLAILVQLLENRTAQQIQQFDVDEFFTRLHLDENLSPNRHVGIYGIVDMLKQQALALDPANNRLASAQ